MPTRPEITEALHKLRFTRFLNSRMLPAAPKGFCKWCGEKAARVYCSKECRREAYVRMGYVDSYVLERDKGICFKCGIDAVWVNSQVIKIKSLWRRYRDKMPCSYSEYQADFGLWWTESRLWEAHHIIPVSKGGGCCGLENYQTICLRCHKKETAKMRSKDATNGKEKAKKRRQSEIMLTPIPDSTGAT